MHFPLRICATNGTAGSSPGPALIGQEFVGHGSNLQSSVGPQHMRPHPLKLGTVLPHPPDPVAYLIAVGVSPLSGDRSIVI